MHLTPQLSKVVERIIGHLFQPFLVSSGAFGPNQFAYTPKRGHRDALALNVLRWIMALGRGSRVGLYCSDVSGAFDRVPAERLIEKLRSKGVHPQIVQLISSWLEDRTAIVIVDGRSSQPTVLANSVFQGTVWGPPLLNVYYEDARLAVNLADFEETVFADDLNCFREYDAQWSDKRILEDMAKCQDILHQWGVANQVIFDPSKESFHILHQRQSYGENFHLLGVTFDPQLLMNVAACEIAAVANHRLTAVLRCRRHYSAGEAVNMYKAQVLSFIEASTAAIYHAPPFFLSPVDRVQQRLLSELQISTGDALMHFNLAPLACRRDMAMLGLIHRAVLGEGPSQFGQYFKPLMPGAFARGWAHSGERHSKQLADPIDGTHTRMMERSVLGLIDTYNRFPQCVVDAPSVCAFQTRLQSGLKLLASREATWENLFRINCRSMSRNEFQSLFL